MLFSIDNRENACISYINSKQISNTEIKPLDIGDFTFSENNIIHFLFERKTLSDIVSSIKDGRYSEQKARILSYRNENPNVYLSYIIETSDYSFHPSFMFGNMNNKSLTGMLINTSLRDGIFIWFTKNVQDTCEFLINIHNRITETPEKYLNNIPKNYETNAGKINVKKKINNDTRFCFISQLSCIPGISNKKAIAIIDALNVKTVTELIQLVTKDDSCLSNINGVGAKLSNDIKEYLGLNRHIIPID